MDYLRYAKPLWIPLVSIIVLAILLVSLGHQGAADAVVDLGLSLWIVGVTIYIVFFDSKKRWPGTSWMQRLGNVFTFRR